MSEATRRRRTRIIASGMPLRGDMYGPVMTEIAVSVTTTARRHGYDVLLITSDDGPDLRRLDAASQDTAPEDERVLPAPTLTVRQSTGPAELS